MNNDGFNGRFHDEYFQLKRLASKFPNGVQFEHVFGHEGEHGNEKVRLDSALKNDTLECCRARKALD